MGIGGWVGVAGSASSFGVADGTNPAASVGGILVEGRIGLRPVECLLQLALISTNIAGKTMKKDFKLMQDRLFILQPFEKTIAQFLGRVGMILSYNSF